MKRLIVSLLVAAALTVAITPALAQTPPLIRAGVSAAGVDLSGLSVEQAAAKLNAELLPRLAGDILVTVEGRSFTMTMAQARLNLDAMRTAKRALYAAAGTTSVAPKISHSRLGTDLFVRQVARDTKQKARNARIKIGTRRIQREASRSGKSIDVAGAQATIDAAIDNPAAPRVFDFSRVTVPAAVTAQSLRHQYNTVITVDRATFTLRLFKGFELSKTYSVAVGQPAYPTPSGTFQISNKQVNPVWSVPNSPWAGELAGTTVTGGTAANPLKARWMGLADGIGIHGTGEEWSIGSRASHGCIRMRVADVIDLYPRVPLGAVVVIR